MSEQHRSDVVHRLRLGAVCLALVVLAFLQAPGRVVSDTKLDLALDPSGFLARAGSLWDDQGFFGQLQNQAYGYFFPMGPFFVAGDLLGAPDWVVQRGWHATLLVSAFLGTYLLVRALRLGSRWAAVAGGLVYALAPRMLTLLGPVSAEALPMALAPWVLLPLVLGARGGSPRRAAALSGLAVLAAGGINAVAVAAVLPLPALWLLTREPGPRRRALAGWWVVAVGAATLWWAAPLLLLGRYSPPFLDWIESSAVTTAVTTPLEILRGTSHWAAYAHGLDGPAWPAGWALVGTPAAVVATTVLAAAGLAGLLRAGRHRGVLLAGVVVGLLLVGAGHVGPFSPPWAAAVQDLLDGPLAPLRNVHKADVVLRLPLAVGVAALLTRPPRLLPRRVEAGSPHGLPASRALVTAVVVAALVVTTTPALLGRLAPRGAFPAVPDYWQQAADWLGDSGTGRSLLVPAAPFGTYVWGSTRDEPLQVLASSPWAVRDVVPLSSAGNIRFLDAVEQRLASGRGSPGLAEALAHAGVGRLVVRNDLDWVRTGSTRPELVRQALRDSPGLERVAAFGPGVDVSPDLAGARTREAPLRAVEVWDVAGEVGPVSAPSAVGTLRLSGGPESLLAVADRGLLAGRAAVLAGDDPGVVDPSPLAVQTDGNRDRERSFAVVRGGESATAAAADAPRQRRAVTDYLVSPGQERRTTAELIGVRNVDASTSAADVDALAEHDTSAAPWAALDGSAGTGWRSAGLEGAVGQWWEVGFDEPRDLTGVQVRTDPAVPADDRPSVLRVVTDSSDVLVPVDPGATTHRLPVTGPSSTLRLQLAEVAGGGRGSTFSLLEVELPGARPERGLRAPAGGTESVPVAGPLLFRADPPAATGCVSVRDLPRCGPSLEVRGEDDPGLDRRAVTAAAADYDVEASVVPRPGPALDRLLAGRRLPVAVSSSLSDHPWAGPAAMVDGDRGTGWRSRPGQAADVTVELPGERVTRLVLRTDRTLGAARPVEVDVVRGRDVERVEVGEDGVLELAAPARGYLGLRVVTAQVGDEQDPVAVADLAVPVGISELTAYDGVRRLPWGLSRSAVVDLPCGEGPELLVSGLRLPTTVRAMREDLLAGRPVPARVCGSAPVNLGPGEQRVRLASSSLWVADRLSLLPREQLPPVGGRDVEVVSWGTAARSVEVGPGETPAYLMVAENHNPGWRARLGGVDLEPVRLDGWRQGFVVPAGAEGRVRLTFAPQAWYQGALGVGALAVLGLLALAALRSRPSALPACRPRRGPAPGWSLVPVAGFLLAGPWGAAAGTLVAAPAAASRRARRLVTASGPVLLAAVGLVAATRPWGSADPFSATGAGELLVVVAVLAAVAVSGPARFPTVRRPQDRTLQQHPAEPGDDEADGQRDQQDQREATGERGGTGQVQHPAQDQQVPEEQRVGHRSQPAQRD